MTRIIDTPQGQGGVRLLVLGAGHYPNAQTARPKVPVLPDIGSAAKSAIDFATLALTAWRDLFGKPIASVDLLVNDKDHPEGITFACDGVPATPVDAPSMANIVAARSRWLKNVTANDILIFYCCGHGIWLPSYSRTFLASDFGVDEESVWPSAVALDDFALGLCDKAPRQQWMIFDCCANTPPPALRNARPAANPLVEPTDGLRKLVTDTYGPLIQAMIASASPGARAYGREGTRSRFMDVFIEACSNAGFKDQGDDGRWQLSLQGLEAAMSTYRFRVAAFEDRNYYTFSRLTTTDAEQPPVLMTRDTPSDCTLLVTSEPSIRLKACALDIYRQEQRVDGQPAGPNAEERFRRMVESYEMYRVDAVWPGDSQSRLRRALPPLLEVKF